MAQFDISTHEQHALYLRSVVNTPEAPTLNERDVDLFEGAVKEIDRLKRMNDLMANALQLSAHIDKDKLLAEFIDADRA